MLYFNTVNLIEINELCRHDQQLFWLFDDDFFAMPAKLLYNYQAKGKTTISSKRQSNLHVYIYSQL